MPLIKAPPQWNGTPQELKQLMSIADDNCTCEYDDNHIRTNICNTHSQITINQRLLDGLLFMRRIYDQRNPGQGQRQIKSGL